MLRAHKVGQTVSLSSRKDKETTRGACPNPHAQMWADCRDCDCDHKARASRTARGETGQRPARSKMRSGCATRSPERSSPRLPKNVLCFHRPSLFWASGPGQARALGAGAQGGARDGSRLVRQGVSPSSVCPLEACRPWYRRMQPEKCSALWSHWREDSGPDSTSTSPELCTSTLPSPPLRLFPDLHPDLNLGLVC